MEYCVLTATFLFSGKIWRYAFDKTTVFKKDSEARKFVEDYMAEKKTDYNEWKDDKRKRVGSIITKITENNRENYSKPIHYVSMYLK